MEEPSGAQSSLWSLLGRRFQEARLWAVAGLGVVGVVVALALPLSARSESLILRAGDVSSQDVLAPYALSYTSEVLTEAARQAAADEVPAVYDPPDSRVAREQLSQLRTLLGYIDAIRGDVFGSEEQRLADLASVRDVPIDAEMAGRAWRWREQVTPAPGEPDMRPFRAGPALRGRDGLGRRGGAHPALPNTAPARRRVPGR